MYQCIILYLTTVYMYLYFRGVAEDALKAETALSGSVFVLVAWQ